MYCSGKRLRYSVPFGERALDLVVAVEQRDAADLVVGEALLEGGEVERLAARAAGRSTPRDDDGGDDGEDDAEDEEATSQGHGAGSAGRPGGQATRGPGSAAVPMERRPASARAGVLDDVGRGSGTARPRRARSPRRTSGGIGNPTYLMSRSDFCSPSFTSSAHDLERRRVAGLEVPAQVREREPGVDDVLDDQDVPVGEVEVEVLDDPHDTARARRRAVRRHRHEVELDGQVDRAGEVAHEHERALEHPDEQRRPVRRSRR